MKKYLFLIFFLSATIMVNAQTTDETKVVQAVEKLRLAMISGDRTALQNIASEKLGYGHSSGKLEDRATFVETIASGRSDFVTIDLKNQIVKVSGKIAIVRHELQAKTNDNGKPGEVHIGIVQVWQKEGKDWKLFDRQAYKLPQ